MRLLNYIEIENFKCLGDIQHIDLDHPTVIIGPNNCGKTSAIQAIALWAQAIKTWWDAKKETEARERKSTALNRLAITAVPVQKTRYFWHNTRVHSGHGNVLMSISAGLPWKGKVVPVKMNFRFPGDELVYCVPDDSVIENEGLLEYAAHINVELLYPMSGLVTEEPVLKTGRINVLLGQGETAQVLRNLCLIVKKDTPEDWKKIKKLVERLFSVTLGDPEENIRGSIELYFEQPGVKEKLDVALAGRGFQQLLLIFAYLFSHKRSVLLIDEPDAHLEILRQKQVYILLRELAEENFSQVILVTHSEVILNEALEHNLTFMIGGHAENLTTREMSNSASGEKSIRSALEYYGAEHYVKAREKGYVLYVEGGTDIDMLHALAVRLDHPAAKIWDESVNAYYVRDNHAEKSLNSELERVEFGYGINPKNHFFNLRSLIPDLCGIAILDNDGRDHKDSNEGGLTITYWKRYEAENYFITPEILSNYAKSAYRELELFQGHATEIKEELDRLVLERVFKGEKKDYDTYKSASSEVAKLIWETKTERIKLSDFAEDFFRQLSGRLNEPMLLRKGELHQLVKEAHLENISDEVRKKLDLISTLFKKTLES